MEKLRGLYDFLFLRHIQTPGSSFSFSRLPMPCLHFFSDSPNDANNQEVFKQISEENLWFTCLLFCLQLLFSLGPTGKILE